MKNRLSNLYNISDKKKIIKTLCVIIIGIFLITNGVNAAQKSRYVEDSIFEGYGIVDSMVFDASSFFDSFFQGITFGLPSMRESFFTAEDGDILSITVSSNRSKLNGNTVNLTLISPTGQRQNIVFNESSTQEYVELYEGVWAFTFNGYFDRTVLNNTRKSVNDVAGSITNEN